MRTDQQSARAAIRRGTAILLLSVLVLGGAASAGASGNADHSAPEQLLFSVPVGQAITYAGTGPEQALWGPSGLAVAGDGVIWIADGARHRLVGFSEAGTVLRVADLNDDVVGIGDIASSGNDLAVLDIASEPPAVVVVDWRSGTVRSRVSVPSRASLANGLSGIAIDAGGTIVAELEGGITVVPVARISADGHTAEVPRGAVRPSSLRQTPIGSIQVGPPLRQAQGSAATLKVGSRTAQIRTENLPGTVRLIGASRSAVYLEVSEVSQDRHGTVLVDSTVRTFNAAGVETGVARVPEGNAGISVGRRTAVTPADDVLALVPMVDRLDVVSLTITPGVQLPTVLPPYRESAETLVEGSHESTVAGPLAVAACVSRTTMNTIDVGYRGNNPVLSDTNINGSCSGRTKPRYLGAAGKYKSTSYDWGGFDTVGAFNNAMSAGGRAGNINTSNVLSCAYGVDCSGFVSRVWQRTSKYGTSTLPNISTAVPVGSGLQGDIFNKSGSHVVLFKSFSGNGYYISEATITNSYDRVIYRWVSTSYVSGYSFMRFNSVC